MNKQCDMGITIGDAIFRCQKDSGHDGKHEFSVSLTDGEIAVFHAGEDPNQVFDLRGTIIGKLRFIPSKKVTP